MSVEYKDLTDQESRNFTEFLQVTRACSPNQLAAMDHQIPMTRELFEECMDVLISIHAVQHLDRLMDDFPEFLELPDPETDSRLPEIPD